MSPLKLSNDPTTTQYRKPRADVYTVLLVLALLALIVAILCLWGETAAYEGKNFKGAPSVSAPWNAGDTWSARRLA